MNQMFQQYQAMSNGQPSQPAAPANNPFNQLLSFAQNFKGDPKQQVMNLLQSRGINMNSPAYNAAVERTNSIYSMIYGKK